MRRTIDNKISISGVGLHTGQNVTVTMHPGELRKGIQFYRTDLGEEALISADVSNAVESQRCTTLKKNNYSISTVEHILSAIYGAGIHDLKIEVHGPEIPILDGSAAPFFKLINEAGIIEREGPLQEFVVEEEFSFHDEETGSEYIVIPKDELEVTTLLEFPGTSLSFQYGNMKTLNDYEEEIARSRTFVLVSDLIELTSNDLIKGGDLSNALVIVDKNFNEAQLDNIASKMGKDRSELEDQALHYDNEPARHKILDILGDLALTGFSLKAKVIAKKPGHKGNIAFAKELKRRFNEYRKIAGRPKYDPNEPPIIDTEGVKSLIPHRYPFLFVDKIIELSDTKVVGVKNITVNEGFFQGHFPGNPIFPGVLQMEALAQTGGILALSAVEAPSLWDTYFLKMDKVKFKQKVVPGDTLILKMELLTPIRRGIVHMKGTAYVGDKIVSEGELIAQIVKRES